MLVDHCEGWILDGCVAVPAGSKICGSRSAAQANQAKSKWIREKLLGKNFNIPAGDLRKLWSLSRILSLDGQAIATGLINLRVPPSRGVFVPDHPPSPPLNIPLGRRLDLRRWGRKGPGWMGRAWRVGVRLTDGSGRPNMPPVAGFNEGVFSLLPVIDIGMISSMQAVATLRPSGVLLGFASNSS